MNDDYAAWLETGVREIVLAIWFNAVACGERDIETALREIAGPLSRVPWWQRREIGWTFVRDALALAVTKRPCGKRKPRGLPTAWIAANVDIVQRIALAESLPLDASSDTYGIPGAFPRAVEVWASWGIQVTVGQVIGAYYRGQRNELRR